MTTEDYEQLRRQMVRQQLRANGVHDERVLSAMYRVPRHEFIPPELRGHAYEDRPVPIGQGQTISQPLMVGHMTQLLALEGTERVLEIGTGSGYQTAILALLAQHVVSVERVEILADRARALLMRLGTGNAAVYAGDGTLGWPGCAPYDAILVTAGGPQVPPALQEQLAPGGRLVCPVGERDVQQLIVVRRTERGLTRSIDMKCVFVPLIGNAGWPDEPPA
ncbi:MAG: protein-L-isoaspartate(D-aspartate) O-methyltransferase [Candidatus Hydrogenedentes bacterium]|nr:protein-L-isoaspartate(D-aspartate) O-methyltransferase [Candidatus Hydrogenedentota bacterium]